VASVVENAKSPTIDNVKGFVHLEMSVGGYPYTNQYLLRSHGNAV